MHIQAERGALCVVLNRPLDASDVRRIHEAISALGPLSSLTLDFSNTGGSVGAQLSVLATLLSSFPPGKFTVRGLAMQQYEALLKHLGRGPDRVAA